MMSLDIQNDYLEYASVLDDKYMIIDSIGFGRYAKVKLAIDVQDKQKYAIKIMKTDPTTNQNRLQAFINEVSTQTSLDYKHIIKIVQCKIDGQYRKIDGRVIQVAYFVMELADQGELFQLIEQTSIFSEKFARNIFQQLIKGIEYMHERGLVHRDIKSENVLFSNGVLKLADFGFCSKMIDEKGAKISFEITHNIGSPEYNPPELSSQANNNKLKYYCPESVDLFAAGVILFSMVMKSAPFKNTKPNDPYFELLRQDKGSFWQVFSELNQPTFQFKDFLEKLLDENPNKRLNLEQIKKHPWMQGPTMNFNEYQKELRNRHDIVISKQKMKVTNKREAKFSARKSIKRVDMAANPKMAPKYLQESLEIIDAINAKLMVKQSTKSKENLMVQKQNQKRNSDGSKKSSPATPPNDSDN